MEAVIGKLFLFLAPIIVLTAVVWVSAWVGIGIGRARERARRDAVDPQAFEALARWGDDVLAATTSPNLDDITVLPEPLRERGYAVVSRARTGVPGSVRLRS